jgi:hypothetical protein
MMMFCHRVYGIEILGFAGIEVLFRLFYAKSIQHQPINTVRTILLQRTHLASSRPCQIPILRLCNPYFSILTHWLGYIAIAILRSQDLVPSASRTNLLHKERSADKEREVWNVAEGWCLCSSEGFQGAL